MDKNLNEALTEKETQLTSMSNIIKHINLLNKTHKNKKQRPRVKNSKFSISKASSVSRKDSGIVISGRPRDRGSAFRGSNSRLDSCSLSHRESISNEEEESLALITPVNKSLKQNQDLMCQTPRLERPSSQFFTQPKNFEEKECQTILTIPCNFYIKTLTFRRIYIEINCSEIHFINFDKREEYWHPIGRRTRENPRSHQQVYVQQKESEIKGKWKLHCHVRDERLQTYWIIPHW